MKMGVFYVFAGLCLVLPLEGATRISTIDNLIPLGPFSFIEDSYAPGKYINAGEAPPLQPYDGRKLYHENQGELRMYTFNTSFQVAPELKGKELAFFLSPFEFGCRLYLNGHLLTLIGRIEPGYDANIKESTRVFVPGDMLNYGDAVNTLSLELYAVEKENYPLRPIWIGDNIDIMKQVYYRDLVGIHFIQGAGLVSLLCFVYFLFLFRRQGRKDKKLLWFALLCFSFFFAYTNMTLTHQGSNLVIFDKISWPGLTFTVMFLTFFLTEYTRIFAASRIFKGIILGSSLISFILFMLCDSKAALGNVFSSVMTFVMVPQLVLALVLINISLIKHKDKKAFYLLAGILGVLITSVSDISHSIESSIPYVWSIPIGFFLLVICMFLVLALEQAELHKASVLQAARLKTQNESLNKLISEVIVVSENLRESGKLLEGSVQNASEISVEYSKSNKQITENTFNQFGYVEGLLNRIKSRIAESGEKVPAAIGNQTNMVERITSNVAEIDSQIVNSLDSIERSAMVADNLSRIAKNSSLVIEQSRENTKAILGYSDFLVDVIKVLEDLAEQTSLLSINVSIEATRAGVAGKGFSVLAGEIRKLANKTKEQLESSEIKIKEMVKLINRSNYHSEQVSLSLEEILKESGNSADMVRLIDELIKNQKRSSSDILKAVNQLLAATHSIRDMSASEQEDNQKVQESLEEVQQSFEKIARGLKEQETKEKSLTDALKGIEKVMQDNQHNINRLGKSIQTG